MTDENIKNLFADADKAYSELEEDWRYAPIYNSYVMLRHIKEYYGKFMPGKPYLLFWKIHARQALFAFLKSPMIAAPMIAGLSLLSFSTSKGGM